VRYQIAFKHFDVTFDADYHFPREMRLVTLTEPLDIPHDDREMMRSPFSGFWVELRNFQPIRAP